MFTAYWNEIIYRRPGFNCETNNCELRDYFEFAKIEMQTKLYAINDTWITFTPAVSSFQFSELAMSLRLYFKPTNKLPTADEAGLSANVVKEVNQVVTSALERSKASAGKNRKYTTIFTPDDRAAIARYAANDGNSAAVNSQ